MKTNILKILRNANEYTSGQELCDRLGVSRTAVWKVINQLKESGYQIEGIQNKGYKISSYPDSVNDLEILSRLETVKMGRVIKSYKEVDSTNNKAKLLADEGAIEGTLVVAEKQTGGKGRRGKFWDSPSGEGIWMSIILKPNIHPINASMLTLVAAMAVSSSIRKKLNLDSFIKWPNDIVINKKKVCGILTEMSAEIDYVNHVVVGIGINVNNKSFTTDIKDIATSLYIEKNDEQTILRADLITGIMEEFEFYYESFLQTEDLSLLSNEYNKLLINMNQEVKVINAKEEFTGVALGINNIGELMIKNSEGNINSVISGEVSVRGIYGYT